MNGTLKTWLFVILTIVVLGAFLKFVWMILPFVLVIGIGVYFYNKITKSDSDDINNSSNNYEKVYESKSDSKSNYNDVKKETVIDVDFKDVE